MQHDAIIHTQQFFTSLSATQQSLQQATRTKFKTSSQFPNKLMANNPVWLHQEILIIQALKEKKLVTQIHAIYQLYYTTFTASQENFSIFEQHNLFSSFFARKTTYFPNLSGNL